MENKPLWKSRKFRLMLFDVVLSTVVYFVTKYVAPAIGEDVLWLIAAYQPVFYAVINGIATEDAAAIASGDNRNL